MNRTPPHTTSDDFSISPNAIILRRRALSLNLLPPRAGGIFVRPRSVRMMKEFKVFRKQTEEAERMAQAAPMPKYPKTSSVWLKPIVAKRTCSKLR
jgi:hypothetical protein